MRRVASLGFVLLALCALAAATLADDVPDAATLRALVNRARGPEPTAYRETIAATGTLGLTSTTIIHRAAIPPPCVERASPTENWKALGERSMRDLHVEAFHSRQD